jgi:serine/threonine protein kinase
MDHCANCGTEITGGARYCISCGAPVGGGAGGGSGATRVRHSAETLAAQARSLLEALRKATLGDYEILGEIGRGGMAFVYLAHDLALDRKVAIKVMSPALMMMDPGIHERFLREARTAAQLSHPHIIPVYAVKQSRHLVYFVMKFVVGRSLESVIKEVGAMPIPVVQTVLGQVGSALGHAHRRGVVHRDMKPGNVMLDEDGWVVVTDFGIAKVADQEALTQTGGVVGTPAYMSPEQCAGGEVTGSSDQYSLGIMAYEMITGRQPFAGTLINLIYDHSHTPPTPLRDLRPDCPPEVAAAVMRMLEKDPADRWPSVDDAVAAIGVAGETERDEVKTHILTLVQASGTGALLDKFRTPGSPVPRSELRERDAAARPPGGPAPARRVRRLVWLVPALVLVALGGTWVALRAGSRKPAAVLRPPVDSVAAASLPGGSTVARLDLAPLSVSLAAGERVTIRATARDAAGHEVPGVAVSWESSAPNVAAVSSAGEVRAVARGAAQITARGGSSSAAAVVTVTAPVAAAPKPAASPGVARVVLTPAAPSVAVGATVHLVAVARDVSGAIVPGANARWSTSDSNRVRVSSDGIVTGLAPGLARVEAVVDGHPGAAMVTVIAPPATPAAPVDVAAARDSVAAAARPAVAPPVATPPAAQPPGNPQPLIEQALERYRRAIESRDLTQLSAAYPGLTQDQANAWRAFFANVTDLSATLKMEDLQVLGDRAEAHVVGTYEFRSGSKQTQHVDLAAVFERGAKGWLLTSIK